MKLDVSQTPEEKTSVDADVKNFQMNTKRAWMIVNIAVPTDNKVK